ncbi:MAG TPA: PIN domain-containing protein [Gaiellaceae bacterium]|nr:PIN domain-containing protein [Gaiellaceae bacterium]
MPLVLDTGVVVALLDAGDRDHRRCVDLVERTGEDLVVPAPTLVEIDYWLRKLGAGDAWQRFVADVAGGAYRLHRPDEAGLARAAELEQVYDDLPLGLVDAAVVATCEQLGETKVATLDRRHFSIVRPAHCEALTLLPG